MVKVCLIELLCKLKLIGSVARVGTSFYTDGYHLFHYQYHTRATVISK